VTVKQAQVLAQDRDLDESGADAVGEVGHPNGLSDVNLVSGEKGQAHFKVFSLSTIVEVFEMFTQSMGRH